MVVVVVEDQYRSVTTNDRTYSIPWEAASKAKTPHSVQKNMGWLINVTDIDLTKIDAPRDWTSPRVLVMHPDNEIGPFANLGVYVLFDYHGENETPNIAAYFYRVCVGLHTFFHRW